MKENGVHKKFLFRRVYFFAGKNSLPEGRFLRFSVHKKFSFRRVYFFRLKAFLIRGAFFRGQALVHLAVEPAEGFR